MNSIRLKFPFQTKQSKKTEEETSSTNHSPRESLSSFEDVSFSRKRPTLPSFGSLSSSDSIHQNEDGIGAVDNTSDKFDESQQISNRHSTFFGSSVDMIVGDSNTMLEDGVDLFVERSREWLKSVKIFLNYVEKRASSEMESSKNHARMARTAIDTLVESEMKGKGTYFTSIMALLQQQEAIAIRQHDFASALTAEVINPLSTKRDQHEKSKKRLMAQLADQKKRYDENVAALQKAKNKFYNACQLWEKSCFEKKTEENSAYKVRLDKRTKEEEEAKQKMQTSEEAYRLQLRNTNVSLEELRRYTALIISAFERTLVESDSVFKECVVKFLTINHKYIEELPGMISSLSNQASVVDNKEEFKSFVNNLTKRQIWDPKPHAFEKYTFDKDVDVPITEIPKEKMHEFGSQTKPGLCNHCNLVTFKGVQCSQCGVTSHKKCVEKLKLHCDKNEAVPRDLVVFGVPLEKQLLYPNTQVPFIVHSCIAEIESRGMESEGIFRIAGIKSSVEKLGNLFESHTNPSQKVDLSYEGDINAVTGCLKFFLRELPEPLIPFEFYRACLDVEDTMEDIPQILAQFPNVNYETLSFIVAHLRRVTEFSHVNKMQSSNLAIVFGPTLLRTQNAETDHTAALVDNQPKCVFVERLIQDFDDIFTKASLLRTQSPPLAADQSKSETVSSPPTSKFSSSSAALKTSSPPQHNVTTPPISALMLVEDMIDSDDEVLDDDLDPLVRKTASQLKASSLDVPKDSKTSTTSSLSSSSSSTTAATSTSSLSIPTAPAAAPHTSKDEDNQDYDSDTEIERIARMTAEKLAKENVASGVLQDGASFIDLPPPSPSETVIRVSPELRKGASVELLIQTLVSKSTENAVSSSKSESPASTPSSTTVSTTPTSAPTTTTSTTSSTVAPAPTTTSTSALPSSSANSSSSVIVSSTQPTLVIDLDDEDDLEQKIRLSLQTAKSRNSMVSPSVSNFSPTKDDDLPSLPVDEGQQKKEKEQEKLEQEKLEQEKDKDQKTDKTESAHPSRRATDHAAWLKERKEKKGDRNSSGSLSADRNSIGSLPGDRTSIGSLSGNAL